VSAQVHDRITIDPDKMDGQPCNPGPSLPRRHRAADGRWWHVDEIVSGHPDLEPDDIPAALNYAAEALAEHYYPLRPPA
jgi:uncharacterized protein (DUF433 family)